MVHMNTTAHLQITTTDGDTTNLTGATPADIYRYLLAQHDNFDTFAGREWDAPVAGAVMTEVADGQTFRYTLDALTLTDLVTVALAAVEG